MALTKQERLALREKWHPRAEELALGPVVAALDEHVAAGAAVLDAGTGTGTWILRRFLRRARIVVGADVALPDDRQAAGAVLPVLADLADLPFRDACFNVILCYNVVEHLADPPRAFAGFARLLAPGGVLIVKTPALGAPSIWASRWSPVWLHRRLKGNLGVAAGDVFPTYYRCNTAGRLDHDLRAAGLVRETLLTVDQSYDYLYFSRPTYILGLLYSRFAELPGLGWLRSAIIAIYRKPPSCLSG